MICNKVIKRGRTTTEANDYRDAVIKVLVAILCFLVDSLYVLNTTNKNRYGDIRPKLAEFDGMAGDQQQNNREDRRRQSFQLPA